GQCQNRPGDNGRKNQRSKSSPDYFTSTRIAVDLSKNIAKKIGNRKKQDSRTKEKLLSGKLNLTDFSCADKISADQSRDEKRHNQIIVAIVSARFAESRFVIHFDLPF